MLGIREDLLVRSDNTNTRVLVNSRTSKGQMAYLHWHDYYELQYVIHGSCMQFIDAYSAQLEEGDILIINPGVPHRTDAISPDGCAILVVMFYLLGTSFESLQTLDSGYMLSFIQNVSKKKGYISHGGQDDASILYIMHQILAEHRMQKKGHGAIIRGLLYQLLGYMIREGYDVGTPNVAERGSDIIGRVQTYVEQHEPVKFCAVEKHPKK